MYSRVKFCTVRPKIGLLIFYIFGLSVQKKTFMESSSTMEVLPELDKLPQSFKPFIFGRLARICYLNSYCSDWKTSKRFTVLY
jgi:hypothetical protein